MSSEKVDLKLDWCSHEAAKFACEHWHYSKCMPAGKTVKIGVWENKNYIGCLIYSMGAGNMTRGEKYGLNPTHEICELSRVALNKHKTPVSKMLAISFKMIKKQSPNIKMVISFSDEYGQGHYGGIYQASGFIYTGAFIGSDGFTINGVHYHNRSIGAKGWKQSLEWLKKNIDKNATKDETKKHRYLMPLDKDMRNKIELLRKPYPKKTCPDSVNSNTSDFQSENGGATPTSGLLYTKNTSES